MTIPSTIIKLSDEFIAYLNQDSITIPDSDAFIDLRSAITKAMNSFGGHVFVKLDWSSPRDAAWITMDGSLKCTTFEDIVMLLKASDFISHDLNHAYDGCHKQFTERNLILRQWRDDLNSAMEFRCFVRDGRVCGISQRDIQVYYPFLAHRCTQIRTKILAFYEQHMKTLLHVDTFIMDVHISDEDGDVLLIDINPFHHSTDALLFDYNTEFSNQCEIRVNKIESDALKYQGAAPRFASNRLPSDVVWMSQGANLVEFAQQWQQATSHLQ